MEWKDRVAFVTGGAHGIGQAICRQLAQTSVQGIAVVDLDLEAAQRLADEIGGIAVACDVADEGQVKQAVEQVRAHYGRIDAVFSNAGITTKGGVEASNDDWQRLWEVNVMAGVYLARAVVGEMVERGSGAFIITSSAAGLLTEIGSAAYSATKHAAVALAEWLSVTYRKQGLCVSCICPAGVATNFLELDDPIHQFLHVSAVTAEEVAADAIAAVEQERFLSVSHPEIEEFFQFKTTNYDRWLHNFAHISARLNQRRERMTRDTQESTSTSVNDVA